MGRVSPLPYTSIFGSENLRERITRVREAFGTMSEVVGLVWPQDGSPDDPNAVSWSGAIVSLHEANNRLVVTWKDEDHFEKYRNVPQLVWAAVVEEDDPVDHENADPDGLQLPRRELRY
jgi:uncharacterized protein YndB with AHSA1/START domain